MFLFVIEAFKFHGFIESCKEGVGEGAVVETLFWLSKYVHNKSMHFPYQIQS